MLGVNGAVVIVTGVHISSGLTLENNRARHAGEEALTQTHTPFSTQDLNCQTLAATGEGSASVKLHNSRHLLG